MKSKDPVVVCLVLILHKVHVVELVEPGREPLVHHVHTFNGSRRYVPPRRIRNCHLRVQERRILSYLRRGGNKDDN